MRHLVKAITAVIVLVLCVKQVPAQQTGGWVGQRVVTKFGTVLKVGRQVVDDPSQKSSASGQVRVVLRVYRVDRVKGPWLWLVPEEGGASGWVPTAQVVRYDQAIDYFTSEIRPHPNEATAFLLRGYLWREKGEYDKAIADYTEAIRLDPVSRSAAEAWRAASELKGTSNEASAGVDAAAGLDLDLALAGMSRGSASISKGDPGVHRAMSASTGTVLVDPKDAAGYNVRGAVWRAKGEFDKAIADYNEAIRLDPECTVAYALRGQAWGSKGDFAKAIADFDAAIRLDPTNVEVLVPRGAARIAKGDFDKAIADFNEAIRLDPRDAEAYALRGVTWRMKGDYNKAIADDTEAIRLDPEDAQPYVHRGAVWYLKGNFAKAIADFSESIRLDPEDAEALNSRAWLWATCPDASHRDGPKAVASATLACELTGCKNFALVDTLAAAYAEAGDFAAAVMWQERALEMCQDEKEREPAQARLAQYSAKQPYREEPQSR